MKRSILSCLLTLLVAMTARASTDEELQYPLEVVWNSAIRLVRVDLGLEIVDRDKDAGYIMFRYRDGDRFYPANFEILARENDGVVRVRTTIDGMPSYVERVLLDKLKNKLKQEYGPPVQRKKEAPKPTPPPAPPETKPDDKE